MKLELKKKDEDGATFYRYREDDCLIWFSQYDNGNIYRVNIQGNDGIEYFAVEDETYYPKEFYYTVPRTTKTVPLTDVTSQPQVYKGK